MRDKKPRILIAEDFEDSRTALKLMLNLAGYDVLEAENGKRAVELIRDEKPDLALMDITLPIVDGLEATMEIRGVNGFKRLPIIIISAHDNEDIRNQARGAGATAYISKPVEFEELKKLIENCLNID
jgi:CheY-like chemotaxis protein